jgi:hypothetical protein
VYDHRVIDFVNQSYSAQQLLKYYCNVDAYVGEKFWCPFHKDNNPSAQLFQDNAFYCYAERKQYTPFNIMLAVGVPYDELAKMVPGDFVATKDQKKMFDEALYKQLVFMISKAFQRDHNIASVLDNWISVLEREDK